MYRAPPLVSALIFPCLGLTLLFCLYAWPLSFPVAPAPTDTGAARQPKPARDNTTRLILLRCQYLNCERCRRRLRLTPVGGEAGRWRRSAREAVRLYNQVADDTDPSAFARTALPRHLCPGWAD